MTNELDWSVIAHYKSGNIATAIAQAKARGEDVGVYDEKHPCHHLVLDVFEFISGDAALFYCPYIPKNVVMLSRPYQFTITVTADSCRPNGS